jgi:hypothetical protein
MRISEQEDGNCLNNFDNICDMLYFPSRGEVGLFFAEFGDFCRIICVFFWLRCQQNDVIASFNVIFIKK